jgi:uncharacterized Zn finger protein
MCQQKYMTFPRRISAHNFTESNHVIYINCQHIFPFNDVHEKASNWSLIKPILDQKQSVAIEISVPHFEVAWSQEENNSIQRVEQTVQIIVQDVLVQDR